MRPKKRKTAVARFCGDCGYELAPDSDGTCPMCARFEQVRVDFIVPRPSDLDSVETEQTVSEIRPVIAARRTRSTSPLVAIVIVGTLVGAVVPVLLWWLIPVFLQWLL